MSIPTFESMLGRKVLLLSPHADDAAYSIGGIVAHLSMRAEIVLVTVFGRSGWALPQALRRKSVGAVSALREREDRTYCLRRRLDYVRLPCPDSFVMGYDETTELSQPPERDPRTADVATLIEDLVARLSPHVVIAPCGVGGHVDHQIVRTAAEALNQMEVLYYEDVPYISSLSVAELDRQLIGQGKTPAMTVDIELVLAGKCEDMWGYRSQTSAATIADMLLHASRIGGRAVRYAERLWRCAK